MRKNIFARAIAVALSAVLAAATTTPANAAFRMLIDDGAGVVADILITDQGAGDINPIVGTITTITPVGSFIVNTTTGVSKPILGFNGPEMDLNSVVVTGQAAGTLRIYLTDTGFAGSVPGLNGSIGGTIASGGSLSAAFYANNSNGEFDIGGDAVLVANGFAQTPTELSGTLGAFFGPGAFSGSTSSSGSSGNPFSMTLVAVITHNGPGTSSFDFNVNTVPEPATMAIWSVIGGIGAVAGWRRRRKA